MPRLLAALCAAVFALPALAHDYSFGPLRIAHPWSRPAPPQAPAAVYFTLKNTGKLDDKLLSVSTPAAGDAMLHQNLNLSGTMQMRPLEAGVALPAGGTVEFKPGGLHVMLVDIKKPLKDGEFFPLTLLFAHAGKVTVKVAVSSKAPH
jgi:hypothetical protein